MILYIINGNNENITDLINDKYLILGSMIIIPPTKNYNIL